MDFYLPVTEKVMNSNMAKLLDGYVDMVFNGTFNNMIYHILVEKNPEYLYKQRSSTTNSDMEHEMLRFLTLFIVFHSPLLPLRTFKD
jgi:hypothetical protein